MSTPPSHPALEAAAFPGPPGASSPLAALRRFAAPRLAAKAEPDFARCELCAAPLLEDHAHLLERQKKQVLCACPACSILFSGRDDGRFLRIPRRIVRLTTFSLSDLDWERLTLPIQLAFFVRDASGALTALYPSPAGIIASTLPMQHLEPRLAADPVLRTLQPEVEALLVNRVADPVYLLAPIDDCFRLAGTLRLHWRGLSGGTEVWSAIQSVFDSLQARASHPAPQTTPQPSPRVEPPEALTGLPEAPHA